MHQLKIRLRHIEYFTFVILNIFLSIFSFINRLSNRITKKILLQKSSDYYLLYSQRILKCVIFHKILHSDGTYIMQKYCRLYVVRKSITLYQMKLYLGCYVKQSFSRIFLANEIQIQMYMRFRLRTWNPLLGRTRRIDFIKYQYLWFTDI